MVKADTSRSTTKRSVCPVDSAMVILGDKWSLLAVRDLFAGVNECEIQLAGTKAMIKMKRCR
ncbi:MAG: hypothetical protein JAY90_08045 [Candidatus Thiodiazotropha lotti]|nr:hypothetical protein [Candidatus Thiodiazotropha lotti]